MLRVSKLTDYGTVVMGYLASKPTVLHKATEVAEKTGIGAPTVSKLLKMLARAGLLESHRGQQGGYRLAIDPAAVSIATVVSALEGPLALTECSDAQGHCMNQGSCGVSLNWQRINHAVLKALDQISLAEFTRPIATPEVLIPATHIGNRSATARQQVAR